MVNGAGNLFSPRGRKPVVGGRGKKENDQGDRKCPLSCGRSVREQGQREPKGANQAKRGTPRIGLLLGRGLDVGQRGWNKLLGCWIDRGRGKHDRCRHDRRRVPRQQRFFIGGLHRRKQAHDGKNGKGFFVPTDGCHAR